MSKQKQKRASPWFFFSAVCLVALYSLIAICLSATSAATSVIPWPRGQPLDVSIETPCTGNEANENLVQHVDWMHWQEANENVLAWVSVPDTDINYAIVQAPASEPTFYLSHDLYGNWSALGCPYVDAEFKSITDPSVYIFGHNITFGPPMFASFARFSDPAFAAAHPIIYLQTPDETIALKVSSVEVVQGDTASKHTDFDSIQELRTWYASRYAQASVQIENNPTSEQVIVFVTCSYNYLSNERTLIYAQPLS